MGTVGLLAPDWNDRGSFFAGHRGRGNLPVLAVAAPGLESALYSRYLSLPRGEGRSLSRLVRRGAAI